MWVRNLGGMASSHLNILDVGEEPGWNGLLLLGDGGRELALLDVVQPTQLLHAEHEDRCHCQYQCQYFSTVVSVSRPKCQC